MRGPRALLFTFTAILSVSILSSSNGCSNETNDPLAPAPVCLDAGVDETCTPAYEPSWNSLYTNTLQRSCAASGSSCHASTGRQGGVDLSTPDTGYTTLVPSKVRAGEPECSILVHRVIATSGKVRMPPGRSLSAGEQCAIIKWIAGGAHR